MIRFTVSPAGSDTNTGSPRDPFATVERAIEGVRALKAAGIGKSAEITVRTGEYRCSGIRLNADDAGLPITFKAEGEVILNGGLSLDPAAFVPLNEEERARLHGAAKDKVVKADLYALGLKRADLGEMCAIGTYSTASRYDGAITSPIWCELFVNDTRMEIARYPDSGFLHTGEVIREGKGRESGTGVTMPDPEWRKLRNPIGDIRKIDPDTAARVAGWKSQEGVWCYGYPRYGWADDSTPVRIHTETCEMESVYASYFGTREHAPYYFYNVFEELDAPGEWFLDRDAGILYLYPPCELSSSAINLSLLTGPLLASEGVSDLTFDGFTFAGTRGNAIEITGDGITIENCTIKNVAGWAAILTGDNNTVRGCEILHTGEGGIRMKGGDRNTLTPSGNRITKNHIHHIAEIYRTYRPGVAIEGVGIRVDHNNIHDSAHQAISFHGNEHIMEYNEIWEVCKIADDSSAIYAGRDYTTCGNVIRYNYFHDMKSDADNHIGIFGMYCDDNLGATTITHNIFHRCQSALLLHGGHDMVFVNNLILDACPKSQYSIRFHNYGYWHSLEAGGEHERKRAGLDWQNEIWTARYPHIAEYLTWDPETEQSYPHYCTIARNIIIGHKPIDIRFDHTRKCLKNEVFDNLELADRTGTGISDDGDRLDLSKSRLCELLPGFEPIPLDEIGL